MGTTRGSRRDTANWMMIHSSSPLRPFSLFIHNSVDSSESKSQANSPQPLSKKNNHHVLVRKLCSCGRRRLIGSVHSSSSGSQPDPKDMLKRMHPPRPDWYKELFAFILNNIMKPYEAEVADYKTNLFAQVEGRTEILELGIGIGPNLRYYVGDGNVFVTAIDPNKSMEKYAQAAAAAAGLSSTRFNFIEAVLRMGRNGVVATLWRWGRKKKDKRGEEEGWGGSTSKRCLSGCSNRNTCFVLCSVKDVKLTLQEIKRVLKPGGLYIFIEHVTAKDGTPLRFIQNVLDPLQQIILDGCHLTRETGKYISQAGFSDINMNSTFISTFSYIGPHVYGIATK